MDELTNIKVKAIAFTVKQVTEERMDDLVNFAVAFLKLNKHNQKIILDSLEQQFTALIPKDITQYPNLYDYGRIYLKWLIFTDLYTNGLEITKNED